MDLRPKWVTLGGWASPSLFAIGLSFDCPHCRNQRLAINFDIPIDPDGVQASSSSGFSFNAREFAAARGMCVWARVGDSFETITLRPSINVEWAGHWHGFIDNGEVRPA